MAFGAQPNDSNAVPISSVYEKESNTFPALQGEPGAYYDATNNSSSAAIMSFLRPGIVQNAHNVTGSASKTVTCAFTNNNIAGNSIVVCVGLGEVENGTTITLAVTDSRGNSYAEAIPSSQGTTLEAAIFFATAITAGANTITVTIAGSSSTTTAIGVQIYEVFGVIATLNALDATATGKNAGSTTPTSGSLAQVVPNELAFAAIAAGGGTITAGSGWTLDSTSLSPTGGGLVSFGAQSRLLSTIAALIPTATLSASNAWAMACATFKSVIVPVEGTFNAPSSTNAVLTSVASSASTVVLLALNTARKAAYVYNDSTSVLYLAFAGTASTSAYTVQIPSNGFWEMPTSPVYTGILSGIWSAAAGNARITELS